MGWRGPSGGIVLGILRVDERDIVPDDMMVEREE